MNIVGMWVRTRPLVHEFSFWKQSSLMVPFSWSDKTETEPAMIKKANIKNFGERSIRYSYSRNSTSHAADHGQRFDPVLDAWELIMCRFYICRINLLIFIGWINSAKLCLRTLSLLTMAKYPGQRFFQRLPEDLFLTRLPQRANFGRLFYDSWFCHCLQRAMNSIMTGLESIAKVVQRSSHHFNFRFHLMNILLSLLYLYAFTYFCDILHVLVLVISILYWRYSSSVLYHFLWYSLMYSFWYIARFCFLNSSETWSK